MGASKQDLAALALVTPDEMRQADDFAAQMGISGSQLMARAGSAVASEIARIIPAGGRIALLAGPGKNGGDALVAAGLLAPNRFDVAVFSEGRMFLEEDRLLWGGPVQKLERFDAEGFNLVVDGLYGGGLSRAIENPVATLIKSLNGSKVPVLSIDLPSGICGSSGAILGEAVKASATVTFVRRKPGHMLMPGRRNCGRLVVADIDMPDAALAHVAPTTFANEPGLWHAKLLQPSDLGNKYDRGHAVVFSGGSSQTGAGRMSAMAALRGGAGLVTIASPSSAMQVNAIHLTAIMLKRCDNGADLRTLLEDERLNVFVLGPGFGIGEKAREFALMVLKGGRQLVLDADGITSFKDNAATLFDSARAAPGSLVVTPHAGEFKRLFPGIAEQRGASKLQQAQDAADASGAIVVLKGADTVIAEPNGRAAINAAGTNWLATAGTGDVLSGIIASQLAQGVPAFEAACAGVWMHGRAAELFGPGLIAEDLASMLPRVHAELWT